MALRYALRPLQSRCLLTQCQSHAWSRSSRQLSVTGRQYASLLRRDPVPAWHYQLVNTQSRRVIRTYPRRPSASNSTHNNAFFVFINGIPPKALIFAILGLNVGVFLMWQGAIAQARSGDWSQLIWMKQNFTTSDENLKNGRYWILITSSFSHEGIGHLLFNSFTFYFFGSSALALLSNTAFLSLYLGSGVASSLVSYGWYRTKNETNHASHGASGAIYGVLSFFACVAPTTTFYLYGLLPIPAWAVVPGVLLYDTWGALSEKRSKTDHAGHVGGIVAGILYFLLR